MTKRIIDLLFKVLISLGLGVVIMLQVNSSNSIVYVDAMKLMSGYKGMEAARREYDAKTAIWRKNVDSLKVEMDNRISEYESREETLSARERQLNEELLHTKQEQFLNYQQVVVQKIQREDQELTSRVLTKVNDYIKKYGEENGYEIIMAATQYGNIIYARKGKDITDEVLKGLNKEYVQ